MHRRAFLSASLIAVAGCSSRASQRSPASEVEVVAADPAQGFNFPYLLKYPEGPPEHGSSFLIVEPNNSGHVSLDFSAHLEAAQSLVQNGLGGRAAGRLQLPLLMPVFPRGPDLYTHSLGRTTLNTTDVRLHRPDHQLIAMITHGRKRLISKGFPVAGKPLMTGFSASAMFVTRFIALHPEKVRAVAAGGLSSFVILPVRSLQGERLPFPVGVDDVDAYTRMPFQAPTWSRIPQYLFMGAEDTNDAVLFDDSYSPKERDLVFRLVGREMSKRWETCQRVYANAGASATFVTYAELGHGTNGRIHSDVAAFLTSAMRRGQDDA